MHTNRRAQHDVGRRQESAKRRTKEEVKLLPAASSCGIPARSWFLRGFSGIPDVSRRVDHRRDISELISISKSILLLSLNIFSFFATHSRKPPHA